MVIVSDTSPVSNMLIIGELELIYKTVGKIIIPQTVATEIRALKRFEIDLTSFETANWIEIKKPKDISFVKELSLELDAGEAEAIALSKQLNADYIIIDERIGRIIAKKYNQQIIGLLGILIQAKQKGIVPEIKSIIDKLRTVAGFWITEKLYNEILGLVNE